MREPGAIAGGQRPALEALPCVVGLGELGQRFERARVAGGPGQCRDRGCPVAEACVQACKQAVGKLLVLLRRLPQLVGRGHERAAAPLGDVQLRPFWVKKPER